MAMDMDMVMVMGMVTDMGVRKKTEDTTRINRLGIIIQARMQSTRLPGKVLMPFYGSKTILEIIIERILWALPYSKIVVATSTNSVDDAIVLMCDKIKIDCIRGSETDVLDRFIRAAQYFSFERIVRVCADNPFLDGQSIKYLIDQAINDSFDYVSFVSHRGVPSIKTHWGLFAELITLKALLKVMTLTSENLYHEHVTNFIYENPDKFRILLIKAPDNLIAQNDLRLTVDTQEDFELAQYVYSVMRREYGFFSLDHLINWVDNHPTIKNAMLVQIKKNTK